MAARTPIPAEPQDPERSRYRSDWRGGGWGWGAAIVILVIAVIVIAWLLFFQPADDTEDTVAGVSTATINEIVEQPDEFTGESVAVTGRVDELLTERVILIGSDRAPEDVLVLVDPAATIGGYGLGVGTGAAPLPVGETYQVGDVVQFVGEVRQFDREAMAEELGLVLNEELFGQYQDATALVVDRLDVATVGNLGIVATAPPDAAPDDGATPAAATPEGAAPSPTAADATPAAS